MSKAEKIKSITKKMQSLPTLPHVVEKFATMVESPDVTAKDVGKLISSDQVLSSKVLRLVNSPFYGFPGRISSISHAIILLGFDVIKGVVFSASVFDLMEKSMVGLWEHSLGSAIVAGRISRQLGLPDPEEIATAALLHDIGKVLVKVSLAEDYAQIAERVETSQCAFRDAETVSLGVDHGSIGGWLAKEWNLPQKLMVPIEYHHDFEKAPSMSERVAVVQLADAIVRAFGIGSGGDPWVPQINAKAWEYLDMDRLDLDLLMQQIKEDLEEVATVNLSE